jgi:hypothetical protein
MAVSAHGYPRATKDVHLVPSPERVSRRRLRAALLELDAEPLEIGDFRPDELPVPFAPTAWTRERGPRALTVGPPQS